MTIDSGQVTARRRIPADTFANRLMLARAHAGHLSIREAADLCGLGRGAWTNWERGAQPVGVIDIAEVISEKLNIDRDWLLFGGQLAEPQSRPLRRGRGVMRPNAGSVRVAEWTTLDSIPAIPSAIQPTPCAPDVRSSSDQGIHRRPKARQSAAQPIAALVTG